VNAAASTLPVLPADTTPERALARSAEGFLVGLKVGCGAADLPPFANPRSARGESFSHSIHKVLCDPCFVKQQTGLPRCVCKQNGCHSLDVVSRV